MRKEAKPQQMISNLNKMAIFDIEIAFFNLGLIYFLSKTKV